jgi:hypothetical protein
MSVAGTLSSTRRRWPRPQFSLRLLLLAFTGFAIGFPIWYRWPYEKTEVEYFPTGPVGAPTGKDHSTRITTWQRQWGGSKVKHGPERSLFHDAVYITPYVNGRRHGLYTFRDEQEMRETGHYIDGRKEGTWIETLRGNKVTTNWRHNKVDGWCEFEKANGDKIVAVFATGRLTHFNGAPFDDHLFGLRESGSIDEHTASTLHEYLNGDFVGFPLTDFLELVTMMHPLPIVIDPKTVPSGAIQITGTGGSHGMDLGTVLTLRLAPHGLVCDYRYGRLWITTAEDAKGWRDSTGVPGIQPQAGTELALAWNEPAVAAVTTSPLAEVLVTIARPLGIKLDTSQIAPTADDSNTYATVANTNGIPFRHALGILLFETGCRCRLEGETLVILPPESKSQ